MMDHFERKFCLPLLIIIVLAALTVAMEDERVAVPAFNTRDCREFRRRLLNHTLLSFYDRRHSTNLGIAGLAIFWTGLPAIPLGIAAVVMGKRQATQAVRELFDSGVTEENYQEINRLCAILLSTRPVENASVDGKNRAALIPGAIATALAIFTVIIQACYGVFAFWRSKEFDGDGQVDDFMKDIEDYSDMNDYNLKTMITPPKPPAPEPTIPEKAMEADV